MGDKWKVDLAGKCKVAIVCYTISRLFKGTALSFLLCSPSSCLYSSLSMICWLWPERPLAKLWHARARGPALSCGGQLSERWSHCYHPTPEFYSFSLNKSIEINLFSSKSKSFCKKQKRKFKKEPARWSSPCGTRRLAVSKVWPQAGRVAAHPWMTCPIRPEGTDNGQSLLTLYLCQNVSTFNNVKSTPYKVTESQFCGPESCELAVDGGCGRQARLSVLDLCIAVRTWFI